VGRPLSSARRDLCARPGAADRGRPCERSRIGVQRWAPFLCHRAVRSTQRPVFRLPHEPAVCCFGEPTKGAPP
jgi:hypothetical protein